ncbi:MULTISPECIES: hypothetical protein [unclassified Arthrobacter]|uniref:hypothetical protein n=1 Tax=unclassified Arthrobacter TaxID=235627 RepID=UPI001C85FC8C|nr:hypothetical protein [Arthrobacter sp. MAHUQ-56]MBX7445980.1 hypothetical protein [Arthrobacter sp. MAHUQ-56]
MSQSTESTTESDPFTRPGFIIAAALVVALVAAGIVIFLLPKGQSNAEPAPATSSTATARPSASSDGGKSICGLPSSSETSLGTAPTSKWELVGKMATPADPEVGPGKTDTSGFRSCFAHSPTGSLYAAMNVAALGSSGNPDILKQVADKLLVPGSGRDAALKETASGTSSSGSSTTIQVKGFLLKSYTPSEASVDLAFATETGALGRTTFSMRWMDGDWKVKPSDDGATFGHISQVRDLSGFILWSGI